MKIQTSFQLNFQVNLLIASLFVFFQTAAFAETDTRNVENVKKLTALIYGKWIAQDFELNGREKDGGACKIKVHPSTYGIGFSIWKTKNNGITYWVSRSAKTSAKFRMTQEPGKLESSQTMFSADERGSYYKKATLKIKFGARASRGDAAHIPIQSVSIMNNENIGFQDSNNAPIFDDTRGETMECSVEQ